MSQVSWTIKGRLMLRSQFPQIAAAFGDANGDVPLAGVRVQVSAKESNWDPSGFAEWGEDVTDANGNFQVSQQKDKSARYFRVRVMFKDDDVLKIYPANDGLLASVSEAVTDLIPGGPVVKVVTDLSEDLLEAAMGAISRVTFDVDWITVHEDNDKSEKRGPGTVDLGTHTFRQGGPMECGGTTQRRHADLWVAARKMMDQLDGLGSGLGFIDKQPPAIKYPHSSKLIGDNVEQAYADPLNRVVFLIQNSQTDNFDLETVMHELMHLRNYQHSTGEKGLAWQLIVHGSTHEGRQAKTWTAFHESFAELAKTELHRQMFGAGATIYGGSTAERRPFTRSWLRAQGIRILDDVQRFEYGWLSVFNLLLCKQVALLDINGSAAGASASFDFADTTLSPLPMRQPQADFSLADLLRAFDPLPGFPTVISTSQMTLDGWFARLGAVNPAFDAPMRAAYRAMLDPAGTQQPRELLPAKVLVAQTKAAAT